MVNELPEVADPKQENLGLNLQIRESLAQLEPKDRFILILVDLYKYSYKEAAEVMGISEQAVTSKVFRARADFIKKLK